MSNNELRAYDEKADPTPAPLNTPAPMRSTPLRLEEMQALAQALRQYQGPTRTN
jgi:hypothetical protein